MKFFYALMVFFLSTNIFFYGLVFTIPTPQVFDKDRFIDSLNLTDKEKISALPEVLESFQANKVDDNYFFEQDLEKKRTSAIFLATIYTFVLVLIFIIAFHKKSYIVFPIAAALVLSLVLYSILWIFNFSIGSRLFLDLQNLRMQYSGLKALQFLGIYVGFLAFIILFGSWYKLPE